MNEIERENAALMAILLQDNELEIAKTKVSEDLIEKQVSGQWEPYKFFNGHCIVLNHIETYKKHKPILADDGTVAYPIEFFWKEKAICFHSNKSKIITYNCEMELDRDIEDAIELLGK